MSWLGIGAQGQVGSTGKQSQADGKQLSDAAAVWDTAQQRGLLMAVRSGGGILWPVSLKAVARKFGPLPAPTCAHRRDQQQRAGQPQVHGQARYMVLNHPITACAAVHGAALRWAVQRVRERWAPSSSPPALATGLWTQAWPIWHR